MTKEGVVAYSGFSDERKFIVGLWLRVLTASVFLLFLVPFTVLGIDFPYDKCALAYHGLGALVFLNVVYWYIGKASGFRIAEFYGHWLVDLVLITVVIHGLGGGLLPYAINAYILIVITSAVFVSRRASFAVATGAAVAYSGLIAADAWALIDSGYEIAEYQEMSVGMRALVVAGPVFMVYLVAFIAGTLGDQVNLTNALLSHRNRELKEQNEVLDRMRGELDFQGTVLAHDIRNPVSAAYGALGELRRALQGVGNDEQIQLIDVASENLDRVEDMIEALQQVREGGEIGSESTPVDLADIVKELRVEFEYKLGEKRAKLVVEGPLPIVNGVRARLLVMLRNLLMNAVRYVPENGSGLITVGAIYLETEHRIFVKDNGPGIPVGFQKVIFEMFKKAPQQIGSPGMGLGLALVEKIAEQHRGRVWVESDSGAGSTFVVAFPNAT